MSLLPPLPPLPEELEEQYRPSGSSIIDTLDSEHRELLRLAAELADEKNSPSPRRKELSTVVTAMVTRHLSAEEQYLYPAVRSKVANGDALADDQVVEHRALLLMLAALETLSADDAEFDVIADRFAAELKTHVDNADRLLLPQLNEAADDTDLIRLGNRAEIAKEAAPTRAHPDSPTSSPLNKITEPLIGVVDKVRDAVSGRTTYPQDLNKD
jgi:hemerythrin-like domain-containing protein